MQFLHGDNKGSVQTAWMQSLKWVFVGRMSEGLFLLRFYIPVNRMGSCQAQSVYLTKLLLGRLSPLSG